MPLWVWQGETKSGGGLHQSQQQRDEGECICGLNKNHNLYKLYWYFKIRSLCLEPEKVQKNYINRNESVCFFELFVKAIVLFESCEIIRFLYFLKNLQVEPQESLAHPES